MASSGGRKRAVRGRVRVTQWIGIVCLAAVAIGAGIGFVTIALPMFRNLAGTPPAVAFNKGAMYLPGLSLGLGALCVAMTLEAWRRRPPVPRTARLLSQLAVGGVVVMFLLPAMTHYWVAGRMQDRGYAVCESASHRWLHSRTIVYTRSEAICANAVVDA